MNPQTFLDWINRVLEKHNLPLWEKLPSLFENTTNEIRSKVISAFTHSVDHEKDLAQLLFIELNLSEYSLVTEPNCVRNVAKKQIIVNYISKQKKNSLEYQECIIINSTLGFYDKLSFRYQTWKCILFKSHFDSGQKNIIVGCPNISGSLHICSVRGRIHSTISYLGEITRTYEVSVSENSDIVKIIIDDCERLYFDQIEPKQLILSSSNPKTQSIKSLVVTLTNTIEFYNLSIENLTLVRNNLIASSKTTFGNVQCDNLLISGDSNSLDSIDFGFSKFDCLTFDRIGKYSKLNLSNLHNSDLRYEFIDSNISDFTYHDFSFPTAPKTPDQHSIDYYRQVKKVTESQGDFDQYLLFRKLELETYLKNHSHDKRSGKYWARWFGNYTSYFGTNWIRPLLVLMVLSMFFYLLIIICFAITNRDEFVKIPVFQGIFGFIKLLNPVLKPNQLFSYTSSIIYPGFLVETLLLIFKPFYAFLVYQIVTAFRNNFK